MPSSAMMMSSLQEEHALMTTLLDLLRQEQRLLLAADTEQLTTLTAHKAQLVAQLGNCATQRHAVLAASGFAQAEQGMDGWLARADPAPAAPLWSALLALTREAKEQNRINGMLVNKQLAHTQGALNTLRPTTQGGGFYGPSGQTTAGAASRRFVVG